MTQEKVFIVMNNKDNLLAISDDLKYIDHYFNQFHIEIRNQYKIIEYDDKKVIHQINRQLGDLILEESILCKNTIKEIPIYLTKVEELFYRNIFRQMYSDNQNLIIQMNLSSNYLCPTECKEKFKEMTQLLYEKMLPDFDTFIKNLDVDYVINKILVEPIVLKTIKDQEEEMNNSFWNKLSDPNQ